MAGIATEVLAVLLEIAAKSSFPGTTGRQSKFVVFNSLVGEICNDDHVVLRPTGIAAPKCNDLILVIHMEDVDVLPCQAFGKSVDIAAQADHPGKIIGSD